MTATLQSREALRNVLHPQLALVVCGTVTTNQPTSTTHYLLPTIPPSINIQIHCLPSTNSQCSPSSTSCHNPLLTLSSPPWLDCSVIIPISKPAVTVPPADCGSNNKVVSTLLVHFTIIFNFAGYLQIEIFPGSLL